MTTEHPSSPLRRLLPGLLGLALGIGATLFALRGPIDWHALMGDQPAADAASADDASLWTCGMHPNVIQDEPGFCPICQMDLVPLRTEDGGSADDAHAGHDHASGHGETPPGEREVLFYRNPMDPTVTSPVPAKDSMGMDYVPVYRDEAEGAADQGAIVRIDPAVVQNMNVRTMPVERRDLAQPIRTVGYLDYDQQHMVTVTTKYSGWVEKVYVNYVGEPVRKGQDLFEIYSPELVQTEQELLSALDFARDLEGAPGDAGRRARALVEASRERLRYWDIATEQIRQLEETGKVFRTLTVVAPADGLVMKRMDGLEGMAVRPGMEIFHIADIHSLWLSVEIFEDQVVWVKEGTKAEISFPYFPGRTFDGAVRFVEPELSEKTRTMRVTLEVANHGGLLRKGMFATVDFAPLAAMNALVIPTQAILRTGRRNVAVVALDAGRFAPREVVVGRESQGYSQILSGLTDGEVVVTSAQFLLDSESKLQETIRRMIDQNTTAAAPPPPPPTTEPPVDPHAGHDMGEADPHAGHDMGGETDPHAGHDMGGGHAHHGGNS